MMAGAKQITYPTVDLDAGEMVFESGASADYMYLIQKGSVETLETTAGREQRIAVLEKGDFFGEMAILDKGERTFSVRVLETTRLIKIDGGRLKHLLQRNPEIAVRMLRKLSRQLESSEGALARAATGSDHGTGTVPPVRRSRFVVRGSGEELVLPDQAEITVGRLDAANGIYPDLDLTALDTHISVSRSHARLQREGGDIFVLEGGATNGTFINRERISPGSKRRLVVGDEVGFGAVRLQYLVD